MTVQVRDPNRVNVSVDGRYKFSLDVLQVGQLGLKIGQEYDTAQIEQFEQESQFGKAYMRALEYCLMRPRSQKEMKDYLWRKMQPRRSKTGQQYPGISTVVADRVLERLTAKGYADDEKFAHFWIENRNLKKGIAKRKLIAELQAKGIDRSLAERLIGDSPRSDDDELQKIIAKKQARYPDRQKFMQYLARHGFDYDSIKQALDTEASG